MSEDASSEGLAAGNHRSSKVQKVPVEPGNKSGKSTRT